VKVKAAVLFAPHTDYSVESIELDPPKHNEVLVRVRACGMCHSDEHFVTGDIVMTEEQQQMMGRRQFPIITGHEMAGEVVELGSGIGGLIVGDHVVSSFVPSCGVCPMCVTGKQALCDNGAKALAGRQSDGTSRHHANDGTDLNCVCAIGGFAEFTVVPQNSLIKIESHIPLPQASLVACGVVTGWGSATYAAQVQSGDTVVIVGVGGVGINAVQGASMSGARYVVAVDPVAFKREQATIFGATHVASDLTEANHVVSDLTYGRLADRAIITVGLHDPQMMEAVFALVRKAGRVVLTSVTPAARNDVNLNLLSFAMNRKELIGCLFGNANPRYDVPRLLGLYESGKLKLDELVTRTYGLDEINEGYQDMRDGLNLRGVIVP
jgi:NDMA-dependent alcohol dehydrogenase